MKKISSNTKNIKIIVFKKEILSSLLFQNIFLYLNDRKLNKYGKEKIKIVTFSFFNFNGNENINISLLIIELINNRTKIKDILLIYEQQFFCLFIISSNDSKISLVPSYFSSENNLYFLSRLLAFLLLL